MKIENGEGENISTIEADGEHIALGVKHGNLQIRDELAEMGFENARLLIRRGEDETGEIIFHAKKMETQVDDGQFSLTLDVDTKVLLVTANFGGALYVADIELRRR